jgi:hypothetical protein
VSMFRALLALSVVACNPEPTCEEIELSPLEVDTSSGTPVFRWQGEVADLAVEGVDEIAWSIRCNCLAEERNPDRNAGCKHTEGEYEFRHCLTGPVSYGETPDVDTLVEPGDYDETIEQLEPVPLVSGQEYEVHITAFCAAGRDPDANNSVVRKASFTAP